MERFASREPTDGGGSSPPTQTQESRPGWVCGRHPPHPCCAAVLWVPHTHPGWGLWAWWGRHCGVGGHSPRWEGLSAEPCPHSLAGAQILQVEAAALLHHLHHLLHRRLCLFPPQLVLQTWRYGHSWEWGSRGVPALPSDLLCFLLQCTLSSLSWSTWWSSPTWPST